jgi:hypothetical protein
MKPPLPAHTPEALPPRSSLFRVGANLLESSHRELQEKVVRLLWALEDSNQVLRRSLTVVESTRQIRIRIIEAKPRGLVIFNISAKHRPDLHISIADLRHLSFLTSFRATYGTPASLMMNFAILLAVVHQLDQTFSSISLMNLVVSADIAAARSLRKVGSTQSLH